MRFEVILLLGIFLIGGVLAEGSSTETEFNVRGCTFQFEGDSIGVVVGMCSGGDASGYFYCGSDAIPWVTTEEGYGCSMGATDFSLGDDFCCPAGMFCNKTASGRFRCDRRTVNCFDQESESECEDAGCIWLDITEECADGKRDYDCSYYDNQVSCLEDIWNLGTTGIGTELCGTTIECDGEILSVPDSSCKCEWYPLAPVGERCQIKLIAVQMFYSGVPDKFECSNTYSLGECIDGIQSVSWFSENNIISGFESGIPQECLEILGCDGGEDSRFCGEPLIKLSGFSLFGLVAVFAVIVLFYFFRKE